MKEPNWDKRGVIVSVVLFLISGAFTLFREWDWLSRRLPWLQIVPWVGILLRGLLVTSLIALAVLSYRAIRKFRLKPRLTITVKDSSVRLSEVTVSQRPFRTVLKWNPICYLEIRNRGAIDLYSVAVTIQLIPANKQAKPLRQSIRTFSLAAKRTAHCWVSFDDSEFSDEHAGLYPDGAYQLVYHYSCEVSSQQASQRTRHQGLTAKAKGRFQKADWRPTTDSAERRLLRICFPV
jgi:hypothetical protein